jgi:LysM repeat protein
MFDSALDIEHVFGHRRGMSSPQVRRRRAVTVSITVLLLLGAPAVSRAFSHDPAPRSDVYVVRTGDTVWSIAVRQAPGQDPRRVVDAIVRTNGVDAGHLIPGQELTLPA